MKQMNNKVNKITIKPSKILLKNQKFIVLQNENIQLNRSQSQSQSQYSSYFKKKSQSKNKKLPATTLNFIRKKIADSMLNKKINTLNNNSIKSKINSWCDNKEQLQSQKNLKAKLRYEYQIKLKKNKLQIENNQQDKMKNKQNKKKKLTSWQIKEAKQFENTTFRPLLTYTTNKKINKKVEKKRNDRKKNYNTFEALYQDSIRYEFRKKIKKEQAEKNKPKIKINNFNNYVSIYDRLDQLIQKNSKNKRYNQPQLQVDPISGHKKFQPDLSQSNRTYKKLFLPILLNKKSIQLEEEYANTLRMSVRQNVYSINNFQKTLPTATSVLNRSLEIVQTRDDAIINRIVSMFYDKQHTHKTNLSISLGQKALSRQQKYALRYFLQQIKEIQDNQNINQPMFCALLLKYFKKMNFYDKQVLREPIIKRNRRLKYDQCVKNTYTPKINERSKSLQSLSPFYEDILQYI